MPKLKELTTDYLNTPQTLIHAVATSQAIVLVSSDNQVIPLDISTAVQLCQVIMGSISLVGAMSRDVTAEEFIAALVQNKQALENGEIEPNKPTIIQ
jgi:hypothetical protein